MNRYDAIVIGAGANGLATATLLARKNRRVLVLERRDVAGGTNATEEFHPGFRANACRDDVGWIPESLVRQDPADGGTRLGRGGFAAGGDVPRPGAYG
jgi:flavin-dependent dehydrogenase